MTQLFDPAIAKTALVVLTALSLAYIAISTFTSYWKLRQFSGPRLAAFSQLWLFNVTANGDLYLAIEKLKRKYGNFLLTTELELVLT